MKQQKPVTFFSIPLFIPLTKKNLMTIKTKMSLGKMDCPPSKINKMGRKKENTPLQIIGVFRKSVKFLLAPLIAEGYRKNLLECLCLKPEQDLGH